MLTTHKLTGGAIRLGLGIGGFLHTGGGLVNSEEEHGIKRDLRLIFALKCKLLKKIGAPVN